MVFLSALRTYAGEDDVVRENLIAVEISDSILQSFHISHVYIMDFSAFHALHVIVPGTHFFETVSSSRHTNPSNLPLFSQLVQVSIHCSTAKGRIVILQIVIDFVCRRVPSNPIDSI